MTEQSPGRRWDRVAFAIAAFLIPLGSYLQVAASRDLLWSPPENGGDADDYERLGYNLASGLGFGFCPSDAEICNGQRDPEPTERCDPGCSAAEFELTAYRPPGFPFLVAAIYKISPLNFFAVRVVNCICFALAVAVVAIGFARQISVTSGVGVVVLCSIDPRMRESAGTFLTENLATLMFSVTFVSLLAMHRRPSMQSAFWGGVSFSGLVFVRSFYVAWYPAVWIATAVVFYVQSRSLAAHRWRTLRMFAIFAFASIILTAPWWIRNCLVLDALMPTGTQGGIGIADGFSDSAYINKGDWRPTTAGLIYQQILSDPKTAQWSRIELEKEACQRGFAHAKAWIREHPWKTIQLSWWKLCKLWEYGNPRHMILFGLVFVGMYFQRRHPLVRVALFLMVLNSLTVMATYHTYERFMTPFRPMIHGLATCGIAGIAIAVFPRLAILHDRCDSK
ncbi:MAG: hypothetical protein R3C05_16785 [Pirellulaceae bacterium]